MLQYGRYHLTRQEPFLESPWLLGESYSATGKVGNMVNFAKGTRKAMQRQYYEAMQRF